MIYLELADNKKIIFTNIPENHKQYFQENKVAKKNNIRSLFKKYQNNVSLWMITDDQDLYKSKKIAIKHFDVFQEILMGINDHYQINVAANIHTIVTIQAKMSQQIENLVDINHRGNRHQLVESVKSKIEKSSGESATIICNLSKRIKEIDTHLESLKILDNKTIIDLKDHPLKRSLLSIYAPFEHDFKEKEINVNFERVGGDLKIILNYKVFNLVMHHFFHNAVKYSKGNEEISFVYSQDNHLIISMNSLKIENTDKIFEIGVSGSNTDSLAGDGIGMHVIKNGLNIMNMGIEIKNNGNLEKNPKYSKNKFIIKCNTQ